MAYKINLLTSSILTIHLRRTPAGGGGSHADAAGYVVRKKIFELPLRHFTTMIWGENFLFSSLFVRDKGTRNVTKLL